MLPGFMRNVRNVGIDLVKFSQNYIINEKYAEMNESEALRICVKDAITDGKVWDSLSIQPLKALRTPTIGFIYFGLNSICLVNI